MRVDVDIKRYTAPFVADIARSTVLVAFLWISAEINSLASACDTELANLTVVALRVFATPIRIKPDVDLFAKAIEAAEAVRTGTVVVAGTWRCAEGV